MVSKPPFDGNNYVGVGVYVNPYVCTWDGSPPTFCEYTREFISVRLKEPLKKGKNYCLSFYVSTAEFRCCASNRIGALFTKEADVGESLYPGYSQNKPNYPIKHQVEWNGSIIADTAGWTKVEGKFTADGGEEYMHVGNFFSMYDTDTLLLYYGDFYFPVPIGGNIGHIFSYRCDATNFYIDYFELYELIELQLSKDSLLPCDAGSLKLSAKGAENVKWFNEDWSIELSTNEELEVTLPGVYHVTYRQCNQIEKYTFNVTKPNCDTLPPPEEVKPPVIPNIITPEGNGLNDFLVIKNLQPGSSLTIYNRWGNVLFESKDYQQNWDCNRCSDGTYFYVLITPDGKQYKGSVTVVGEK